MIERYSLPEMSKIWNLNNKYQCWLEVELAVCKALNDLNIIPDDEFKQIEDKADFDVDRIAEIENTTKHDIIAFLTNVAENIGPASRWVHFGLTSSDVLDTATALQLKQAGQIILRDLIKLLEILKIKSKQYKYTLCIGRSHGIHAEPTTLGLKFALWYDEVQRNILRMEESISVISHGKMSGAVGNFAYLAPEVEKIACSYLELEPANITTQVISRDIYAQYMATLALIGTNIEKIAVEIRHLQRTEVEEFEENFSAGQKGSSAMPHKKNPIVSEQLCGLARILRSNMSASFENNALWHERDISHSSVERIIFADSTILVDYMLNRVSYLTENINVKEDNIERNLHLTGGIYFSQALLLKLTEKGLTREEAYKQVQKLAFQSRDNNNSLKDEVEADETLRKYINNEELNNIFSFSRYTRNVDYIFRRVGIS